MAASINLRVTREIDTISDAENSKNSALYALSDEVLLNIIRFLPNEKKVTQSLGNFGGVCVRFKGLVTDYVGRNIPISSLARLLIQSSVDPMQVRIPRLVSDITATPQHPMSPFGLGVDLSKLFPKK